MDYVGYVDEINRFCVAGWVADRDDWRASLTVDVLVKGRVKSVCRAEDLRDQLDGLHPDATGRYAFRYYFPTPLSMYDDHEISVRVSDTNYYLIQQQSIIEAVKTDANASRHRPNGPVLLSTTGRTGSTAVMAVLAQHPNIVVAGARPYEIELGCYYAYALRTLMANGDHSKSLRTDNITAIENRYSIGFNPYFIAGHADVFRDQTVLDRFMTGRLPARLANAFREIILDYYDEVATDQGLEHPIYFAEKSLPEQDSRRGIRFMFPRVREIVLIRDLRDVVCSSTSSSGTSFDRALKATATAARQLRDIETQRDASIMFLKYEDFVLDNAQTVDRLFRFLGLAPMASDERGMSNLFATHATSSTPAASIGRWKRDLTTEQLKQCEVFVEFLDYFQYDI